MPNATLETVILKKRLDKLHEYREHLTREIAQTEEFLGEGIDNRNFGNMTDELEMIDGYIRNLKSRIENLSRQEAN